MINELMERLQKLKTCDVCKLESEPLGGVEMRAKWHCAKCWINLMRKKMK
jgi:hypothetical protein